MLFLLFSPQPVESPPLRPALQLVQASGRVQLVRRGEQATLSMQVPVPIDRAWAVLTNYARTFAAMPDVATVKLVSRQGQKLRLQQVLQELPGIEPVESAPPLGFEPEVEVEPVHVPSHSFRHQNLLLRP